MQPPDQSLFNRYRRCFSLQMKLLNKERSCQPLDQSTTGRKFMIASIASLWMRKTQIEYHASVQIRVPQVERS
jgi:hypothetical protein